MTGTRVFLSSNCYDLLNLRAVLEDFLRNEGYDPLLSNRSDFPVDAGKHRHDVCVDVARTADLLILVLDWRFGAAFVGSPEICVTWAEFRAARDAGVPVFAYVRRAIFNEHFTWKTNPGITPAHCRNSKTFELLDELLDELQSDERGIWLEPIANVVEIVQRLRACIDSTGTLIPRAPTETQRDRRFATFSVPTRDWMQVVLPPIEADRLMTPDEIKNCADALRGRGSGSLEIAMDYEIDALTDQWTVCIPVRPAEDDVSSWFTVRRLNPQGQATLTELEAALPDAGGTGERA